MAPRTRESVLDVASVAAYDTKQRGGARTAQTWRNVLATLPGPDVPPAESIGMKASSAGERRLPAA